MREKTYFSLNPYFGIDEKGSTQIISVPVELGIDTIPTELECYLGVIGKRHFLSYKDLPGVEMMLYLLIEKLEAYHTVYPENARIAGERMIAILESIDHDDDTFPENQVQWIQNVIGK